jgi:sodium/hydrogen antiporter
MPIVQDPSQLNIALSSLGLFAICYGAVTLRLKTTWYTGDALPAFAFGLIIGPLAARLWGRQKVQDDPDFTYAITRLIMGIQLVIAGFRFPARYVRHQWKALLVLLIPVMMIMWLCTTLCLMAAIPDMHVSFALTIASCVTSIDPVLSQAVIRSPFANTYLHRRLREIIAAEAAANDGLGFALLMLTIRVLTRVDTTPLDLEHKTVNHPSTVTSKPRDIADDDNMGQILQAFRSSFTSWAVETALYSCLVSIAFGALVGVAVMTVANSAMNRYECLRSKLKSS